jgi:hypothetical protein
VLPRGFDRLEFPHHAHSLPCSMPARRRRATRRYHLLRRRPTPCRALQGRAFTLLHRPFSAPSSPAGAKLRETTYRRTYCRRPGPYSDRTHTQEPTFIGTTLM